MQTPRAWHGPLRLLDALRFLRGPLGALAVALVLTNLLIPSVSVWSADGNVSSGWMCAGAATDDGETSDNAGGLRCNSCCVSAVVGLALPAGVALTTGVAVRAGSARPSLPVTRPTLPRHTRIRAPPVA